MDALRSEGHLTDYKVYVCPSSTASAGDGTETLDYDTNKNLTYGYVYISPQYSSASAVSADMYSDGNAADMKSNHEEFGNLLYADGHVAGKAHKEWYSKENIGQKVSTAGYYKVHPNGNAK